jgi:hypothetical protein
MRLVFPVRFSSLIHRHVAVALAQHQRPDLPSSTSHFSVHPPSIPSTLHSSLSPCNFARPTGLDLILRMPHSPLFFSFGRKLRLSPYFHVTPLGIGLSWPLYAGGRLTLWNGIVQSDAVSIFLLLALRMLGLSFIRFPQWPCFAASI